MDIEINKSIHYNSAVILYKNKTIFMDYSDDIIFSDDPIKYDFYFKRSLLPNDKSGNVYPLNFNLPLTYKSIAFLTKMKPIFLKDKGSRIEIIRAVDVFDSLTNNSHSSMDIRKYPSAVEDKGGHVIYHTRLWNPDRTSDPAEKERRKLQNDFRINACRIIKDNFKDASVGLFPDELASRLAPDVLLDLKETSKKNYFRKLNNHASIGIADAGLKDSPGWKIGEYLLSGKAVITTPLNISVDHFTEGENYLGLSGRSAYEELPEKIEALLKDKRYLEMAERNMKWSREYIHPFNYLERIINMVEKDNQII